MNTKKKRYFIFVASVLLIISMMGRERVVSAEETSPLGFEVEAIAPATQIDLDINYFYMRTELGVQ